MHWDALWTNVHLATLAAHADGYGEIRDGAIAVKAVSYTHLRAHETS